MERFKANVRYFGVGVGIGTLVVLLMNVGGCGMVRGVAQDIDSAARGVAEAASK